ncbi:MAG: SGNH/GDSL hydrolase family protein [Acidimicrobiales bacterium]
MPTDLDERPSPPSDPPTSAGVSVPAGRVLLVGLVGLVLGALLSADSLVAQAQAKPFGWSRDLSLAVWEPTQRVSHALSLNRPREMLVSMLGRDDGPDDGFEFPPAPAGDVAAPTTSTTASTDQEPAPTTTTVPPEPELRTPTAEDPLRVWVGGDSMSQVFGQSLVAFVGETDLMTSTLDYRISTGLTRPDYFNWPAHLATEMDRLDPEAVVIMFGANDAQGLETDDGQVFQLLTDGWTAEYRRRVAGTMDLLRADGRVVYWVGQPNMRSGNFAANMAGLNEIYRSEAESRPWIRYVDSYALFSNDAGSYEAFLPGLDGRVQDLRQGDGIHLSRPGGDLLARRVLDRIEADADLSSVP